jgi:hypothetical protein
MSWLGGPVRAFAQAGAAVARKAIARNTVLMVGLRPREADAADASPTPAAPFLEPRGG